MSSKTITNERQGETDITQAAVDQLLNHISENPTGIDLVYDEVQAGSTSVGVFNNAATASLATESTSVGAGHTATRATTVQIGYNVASSASVAGSVLIGNGAYGNDSNNVVIGMNSQAFSTSSVAVGYDAEVGYGIVGFENVSPGDTAVGFQAHTHLAGVGGGLATAIGSNTQANGLCSTSLGANATSSGYYSFAGGYKTVASANKSIALGSLADDTKTDTIATATGVNGIAIGAGAVCDTAGLALGFRAYSKTGANAISIGNLANFGVLNAGTGLGNGVSGANSVCIGYNAICSNDSGIAFGNTVSNSAQYGIIIGKASTGAGANAILLGAGCSSSTHTDVIVIGSSPSGAVNSLLTSNKNGDIILGCGVSNGLIRGNQTEGYITINASNNIVPNSVGNATLDSGNYTASELASHVQTKLQAINVNFTCTYNSGTGYFTISKTAPTFTMNWTTANSAFMELGFAKENYSTAAGSFVSVRQFNSYANFSPAVTSVIDLGTKQKYFRAIYADQIFAKRTVQFYKMVYTTNTAAQWSTSSGNTVFPTSTNFILTNSYGSVDNLFTSVKNTGGTAGLLQLNYPGYDFDAEITFEIGYCNLGVVGGTHVRTSISLEGGNNIDGVTGYTRIGPYWFCSSSGIANAIMDLNFRMNYKFTNAYKYFVVKYGTSTATLYANVGSNNTDSASLLVKLF